MDFETWLETYQPVTNHLDAYANVDGLMFETFGVEKEFVLKQNEADGRYVWTLVEGDNGEWIITNGWHFVNRLGYFVTTNPFEGDFIEIMYASIRDSGLWKPNCNVNISVVSTSPPTDFSA